MLQHSNSLPDNQRPNSAQKQNNDHSMSRHPSLNLPDFDVSQVIAKNQDIDIKCQQDRPFEHFFLRANELGYDAHHITHHTIQLDDNPSIKYQFNENNAVFQNLAFPSQSISEAEIKSQPFKKILVKKLQKIAEIVFEFDIVRIQIWDYLSQIKQKLVQQFSKYNEAWAEAFCKFHQYFQQIYQVEMDKRLRAEGQLNEQISRIEQLQFTKNNISLDEMRLKQKIEELQEEIKQQNSHINHLFDQNKEIKLELARIQQYQAKINNYQNQLHDLNQNLDQNSQYIFDLQQKVANYNFELSQKENSLKKQYQISLQQEKQKIQHNFAAEFERVQQEIKQRVMEQLYHQYKLTIQNLTKEHHNETDELKKQLEQQHNNSVSQKHHYEDQIAHLEQQKMNLIEQIKDYQIKLHEIEQIQMVTKPKPKQVDKLKIQQLSYRLKEVQQKCRDKQAQLQYYKSIKNYPQQSIINCRPKKTGNILVLDQSILDKSILKQSAISPSSALNQKYGKSRQVLINNILSRIRMKQQGSIVSQLHQNSFESKANLPSTLRPVSPQSMLLEKEKDVRMKNISTKLQQLRSDIRRQIGMMKN